jgi:hypothetical protein
MKPLIVLISFLMVSVSVPPGIRGWVKEQGFRTGQVTSRIDRDWTVFDGQFFPLSGKMTVKLVSPTEGGGGTVYDSVRYDFVYPRETSNAIKYILAYQQQDAIKNLNVQKLNACLEDVQRMKAPQVKTILWTMLSKAEGRLLKVNCGVTASTTYVTVEEKVIGDDYWK